MRHAAPTLSVKTTSLCAVLLLVACSAPPVPSNASAAQSLQPPESGAPVENVAGRIAFQANLANETSGIYVMDADGSNVVQLIDDPAIHELDPTWSPDGALIAYTAMSADGSLAGGVFVIDPAGTEPILVDGAFAYTPPAWSPDGSLLAVGGDGSERGIGMYDVARGELERLTEDGGTAPHWSPDGSSIAYNVATDVRTVQVASGEVHDVTADDWNDVMGYWTDDGARLVFVSDRDTDQAAGSRQSWIVDADGGEPELLGGPVIAFAHWPSPDGAWLAYAADDGLHLSRADGSEDRSISTTIPADQGPSWAPDSTAFVFSTATEEARDLFIMRVDGEAPEQLTFDPSDESAPSWGP